MAANEPETITYDESRWPFVLATIPSVALGDEAVLAHFARVAAYDARGFSFGIVLDARKSPPPDAARRRLIAEQLDQALEREGNRCIGTAIVLDDTLKRAVFNTLQWLRRSERPLISIPTPEQGFAWLRKVQRDATRRATQPPSADS